MAETIPTTAAQARELAAKMRDMQLCAGLDLAAAFESLATQQEADRARIGELEAQVAGRDPNGYAAMLAKRDCDETAEYWHAYAVGMADSWTELADGIKRMSHGASGKPPSPRKSRQRPSSK